MNWTLREVEAILYKKGYNPPREEILATMEELLEMYKEKEQQLDFAMADLTYHVAKERQEPLYKAIRCRECGYIQNTESLLYDTLCPSCRCSHSWDDVKVDQNEIVKEVL